jgi:HEAT repeat protein
MSALVCLLGGIALFFLTASQPPTPIPPKAIDTALASNAWTDQLSALRYIVSEQLKIEEYPSHRGLESSPRVAVRYYLARALGASRNPQTDAMLLDLLKDPHPNVVCQAMAAVGRRGDSRSIPQILAQIQNTDHWYVQWYAYRALRTLGWKQKIFP